MSQNGFTKPRISDPLASLFTPIAITLNSYMRKFVNENDFYKIETN